MHGKLGVESASGKRSTMSSQKTPGASSSRGTAISLEGTTGTGNVGIVGNRIEDVDIALGQPTAGGFKLEILQDIDNPEGDHKVQLVSGCAAPEHDLPKSPVPDLASELSEEIVDQFYEARFKQLEQELEIAKAPACEDDLEDYDTTDDDE